MKIRRLMARRPQAAIMIAAMTAGSALAATTTTTFDVTATVVDSCSVSATNIAFGNVEPVQNLDISGTGTVTATCSLGTSFAIALDDGSNSSDGTVSTRRMTDGTTNYLSYQIYQEVTHTNVWGETASTDDVTSLGTGLGLPLVMYGLIPSGQQATQTGSYSDTVTVTVTY